MCISGMTPLLVTCGYQANSICFIMALLGSAFQNHVRNEIIVLVKVSEQQSLWKQLLPKFTISPH